MDPISNIGTVRGRDTDSDTEDTASSARQVRPRTLGTSEVAQTLSPRRNAQDDAEEGPSTRRPRGATPPPWVVRPDLNLAPSDIHWPTSHRWGMDHAGPSRTGLPDLNEEVEEQETSEGTAPAAPPADLLLQGGPEVGDELLARFNVPAQPELADVFRLVDMVGHRPDLEADLLRAAAEVMTRLPLSSELRDGLDSRYTADSATGRVVARLLTQLDLFEQDEPGSDDEIDGVDDDLDRQQAPLGDEIQAWTKMTGAPVEDAHAFNDDDNAASFARMLARLRDPGPAGTATPPEQTAPQLDLVLHAVAGDAGLRREVFALAEDALGRCGDNLAEGFSRIGLAVEAHHVVEAVRRGEMDAEQLRAASEPAFRLALLDNAMSQLAGRMLAGTRLTAGERTVLTKESLETALHARIMLRETLGLPASVPTAMRFTGCSLLTDSDLAQLARTVQEQAGPGEAFNQFLLVHPPWRAGMQALHAREFETLRRTRDREQEEFAAHPIPPESDVAGGAAYAAKAVALQQGWDGAEDTLLRRLLEQQLGGDSAAPEAAASPKPAPTTP